MKDAILTWFIYIVSNDHIKCRTLWHSVVSGNDSVNRLHNIAMHIRLQLDTESPRALNMVCSSKVTTPPVHVKLSVWYLVVLLGKSRLDSDVTHTQLSLISQTILKRTKTHSWNVRYITMNFSGHHTKDRMISKLRSISQRSRSLETTLWKNDVKADIISRVKAYRPSSVNAVCITRG